MRCPQQPPPPRVRRDHRNGELDTDVAVVGTGPVGTLLAILLGQKGHRVVLLDKWPTPYAQPRAVTFDHEIARILSILGIDSDNDPAIDHHDDLYYWKNAAGETLLEVDWKSVAASGWRTRYWFSQPELEARLREVADTMPSVTVRRGWEATALEQDDQRAVLSGVNRLGGGETPETITARYVVGADGANSLVRNQLGLEFADHGYFFDWLILDMILTEDLDLGSSHWQLWSPARPTTIVPGGPGRRRWEFMALPGRTRPSSPPRPRPGRCWSPGCPPRQRHHRACHRLPFQARWATQWRKGRGLIAGDAAHLMPPFAGEGMCAGLRDAAIAWRLDLVLDGLAEDGILDSYGTERLDHVKHYIDFSMQLGKIICITDPAEAAARDERMIAELREGAAAPVDTELAQLGAGLWHPASPHGGELSVQRAWSTRARTPADSTTSSARLDRAVPPRQPRGSGQRRAARALEAAGRKFRAGRGGG